MSRNLPYDRASRVADEVFRIISNMVYTELSDPRLSDVHITRVKMTKDLRIARVHFHFVESDEIKRKNTSDILKKASGKFKSKIGSELSLKYTPEMEFYYDDAIDLQEKIESLLK